MRHDAASPGFRRASGRKAGTDNQRVAQHLRVCPDYLNTGGLGKPAQAAGGYMPVHPGAPAIEQDRPAGTGPDRAVDGPANGRRQRDKNNLGALTAHAQDPVAVLLAEVGDIRAGGLEDPQAQESEHGHQREVVWVRRLPGGGQQGFELKVGVPESG